MKPFSKIISIVVVTGILSLVFFMVKPQAQELKDLLNGKKFESRENQAIYRMVKTGKSSIRFENGEWFWFHGDVLEDGTFLIDKTGDVIAKRRGDDSQIRAYLNIKKNELVWDGM